MKSSIVLASSLENLVVEVNINRAWETIRENKRIPDKDSLDCSELKNHKSWCNKKIIRSKETS
jgi:hypothetical protein